MVDVDSPPRGAINGDHVVLRYSYDQILYEPEAVLADLRAALKDAAKRVARA